MELEERVRNTWLGKVRRKTYMFMHANKRDVSI